MIAIVGGNVLTAEGWRETDVIIDGSRVVSFRGDGSEHTAIDATGCLVGPGFVDLHTHLREPGQTWKEDIESGTRAAAAGGYTAVVAMPNTDPPTDSVKVVTAMRERAMAVGRVDVVVAGALTKGRSGVEPADLAPMYEAGVRIFTDDGDCLGDPRVMVDVIEALSDLEGAVLAQHAEDTARTRHGHMHEGDVSKTLGLTGMPDTAESDLVARDLDLIRGRGVGYHIQHVSARSTVEVIRRARGAGVVFTAEVTPHHLMFDDSNVASLDPNFKMYPPLRGKADREALVEALNDGTIDVVATDHAPHSEHEKDRGFTDAPRGVIGLETAASAVWSVVGDPNRFFEVMSSNPAAIAGLGDHGRPLTVGAPGNVVVFDPEAKSRYESFHSRSTNSPFMGMTLPGAVVATIHRGELIHERGAEKS